MKKAKNIFIAATGQNVGKTTTCLGLYDKLIKSGLNSGFIKPVGQRYLHVKDLKVDEDSYLIHEIYKPDCPVKDMSPIAIPRKFTQNYIDEGKSGWILERILMSYQVVQSQRDFVLIEGTGHAGVGSVFDTSNAIVAKALQSKVVLVTDGGIGYAIDNLILNKCLFDSVGLEVIGVIVNKVHTKNYDKIKHYVDKSLRTKGIKLLGVLPFQQRLLDPNMEQICEVLGGKFLAGQSYKNNYVGNISVGAMSASNFLKFIKKETLVITPCDREDLILAALSWHLAATSTVNQISGLVLTGHKMPGRVVGRIIRKSRIPVISTEHDTFTTASMVHDLKVKIQITDSEKIKLSQRLFDKYVDFGYIMDHC